MAKISSFNFQFWLLTLGLIFVWAVALSIASPLQSSSSTHIKSSQNQMIPPVHEKETRSHEHNCKGLCKQCGCMGFYCGEECICECNKDNPESDCLPNMQSSAKKLNIPYQLLIQGPSRNRFVRNALKLSHNGFAVSQALNRLRRSTVTIYKPHARNSINDFVGNKHKYTKNNKNKNLRFQRNKRSAGQLDWFTDIANTLVRPAPLVSRKKSRQAAIDSNEFVAQTQQTKRATSRNEMDRSWFAESPSLLLRPAPLFKRHHQRTQTESDSGRNIGRFTNVDGSFELPIRSVGNLPMVLKDTLRSIQGNGMSGTANEFGDTLRSHFQEGANVLQSQFADTNLELLPGNGVLRDNIQQTLSQIFTSNSDNDRSTPPPRAPMQRMGPSKNSDRKKITWFRPVRFLQRVQQAIN